MLLEVKRLTEAEKRFGQDENLSIVPYAGVLGWFCTKNLQTIDKTVFELPDGGKQKIEDEMDAVCRELALRYYRLSARPGSDGIGNGQIATRINTDQYSYIICFSKKEDNRILGICYSKEGLDRKLLEPVPEIRFIDPDYNILFKIPDGEKIVIGEDESNPTICRYIDSCHVLVGRRIFHICEFAECMERAGKRVRPYREDA